MRTGEPWADGWEVRPAVPEPAGHNSILARNGASGNPGGGQTAFELTWSLVHNWGQVTEC